MTWYEQLLQRWPDFAVTFLGVLLGALLAYFGEAKIARWQLSRQRDIEEQREREQLIVYLERTANELYSNEQRISQLLQVLANADHARVDLFKWASVLSESLSHAAYNDLISSGIHRKLPQKLQDELFRTYNQVADLRTAIRVGAPAVEFFLGYLADQQSADLTLELARTQWLMYRHDLDALVSAVREYVAELKKLSVEIHRQP